MKLIIATLLVLINLYASDYEDHDSDHIDKELSHLNLSSIQNTKIRVFLKTFRDDLKEYRLAKKHIKKQRKNEFLKEDLDLSKLNNLNIIIDNKARSIENKLLKSIHTLLDKRQKEKFVKYFDDWKVK